MSTGPDLQAQFPRATLAAPHRSRAAPALRAPSSTAASSSTDPVPMSDSAAPDTAPPAPPSGAEAPAPGFEPVLLRADGEQKPRPSLPHYWKPGQSGNPQGRRPGIVRVLQRKYGKHGEQLVEALGDIAFDTSVNAKVRVMALNSLLDRGWGRPRQPLDIDAPGGLVFVLPPGSLPTMAPEPLADIDVPALPAKGTE